MALLYCVDCGGQISDQASICPHCGRPVYTDEQVRKMTTQDWQQMGGGNQQAMPMNPVQQNPRKSPLLWVGVGLFGFIFLVLLLFKEFVGAIIGFGLFALCLGCLVFDPTKHPQKQVIRQQKPPKQVKQLCCRKCGSNNINVSVENVERIVGSTSEVRKKSAITRAGNSLGRTGMIFATGGLWALTPKRSKYKEINRVKTQSMRYKTAVCQNCGYSWNM